MLSVLPSHGRILCTRCYPKSEQERPWGTAHHEWPGWRLTHNPLAWGSTNPLVLVLGFSKGIHQNTDLLARPHEEIPFRTHWWRLTRILRTLDLLADGDEVQRHFTPNEHDFAFGSLLRCSVSMKAGDEWVMTGKAIMPRAVSDLTVLPVFANCVDAHLTRLPERLGLVVMLGNDDEYVPACFNIIRTAHPGLTPINSMAYRTERTTWVHVIHCAGQGSHVADWCGAGKPGKQAAKGEQARAAAKVTGVANLIGTGNS